MKEIAFPARVWNRDHTQSGIPTKSVQSCRLEGCSSVRVGVRWSDGKITWPCMRGMDTSNTADWQIL